MARLVGVDGCRSGWVGIEQESETGTLAWRVWPTLRELVISAPPPSVVAVDIPIGLTDIGSRDCDTEARRLLGHKRASSVFTAPLRTVTRCDSFAQANAARRGIEGKGMSIQAWAIVPKVREVDELLRAHPALLDVVVEVHPELCFLHLAGEPMRFSKKKALGRTERRAALETVFGHQPEVACGALRGTGAQVDDILDAFVALWTARRLASGTAVTIPRSPARDGFGLPMQMVA